MPLRFARHRKSFVPCLDEEHQGCSFPKQTSLKFTAFARKGLKFAILPNEHHPSLLEVCFERTSLKFAVTLSGHHRT